MDRALDRSAAVLKAVVCIQTGLLSTLQQPGPGGVQERQQIKVLKAQAQSVCNVNKFISP